MHGLTNYYSWTWPLCSVHQAACLPCPPDSGQAMFALAKATKPQQHLQCCFASNVMTMQALYICHDAIGSEAQRISSSFCILTSCIYAHLQYETVYAQTTPSHCCPPVTAVTKQANCSFICWHCMNIDININILTPVYASRTSSCYYLSVSGPGRRPPAEQSQSAAVDLPPGFPPSPDNGLLLGRPSQPPSQLPSDLPPGFGLLPGNGLPMPRPSQQPAQRADLTSDVVLRPNPSPAMQSGARSSQANARQAVSRQGYSRLATSGEAECSQTASDQLQSCWAAAPQAAPQAETPPATSSQAVASQHVDLPPGFSVPFGQHTLQSAALQGTAAQPSSGSGAVMIQDHRQRQQQVAQLH